VSALDLRRAILLYLAALEGDPARGVTTEDLARRFGVPKQRVASACGRLGALCLIRARHTYGGGAEWIYWERGASLYFLRRMVEEASL
jgi:DNA-binding IscR family transcriptional regulator